MDENKKETIYWLFWKTICVYISEAQWVTAAIKSQVLLHWNHHFDSFLCIFYPSVLRSLWTNDRRHSSKSRNRCLAEKVRWNLFYLYIFQRFKIFHMRIHSSFFSCKKMSMSNVKKNQYKHHISRIILNFINAADIFREMKSLSWLKKSEFAFIM